MRSFRSTFAIIGVLMMSSAFSAQAAERCSDAELKAMQNVRQQAGQQGQYSSQVILAQLSYERAKLACAETTKASYCDSAAVLGLQLSTAASQEVSLKVIDLAQQASIKNQLAGTHQFCQ